MVYNRGLQWPNVGLGQLRRNHNQLHFLTPPHLTESRFFETLFCKDFFKISGFQWLFFTFTSQTGFLIKKLPYPGSNFSSPAFQQLYTPMRQLSLQLSFEIKINSIYSFKAYAFQICNNHQTVQSALYLINQFLSKHQNKDTSRIGPLTFRLR